ncbi:MAG: glycerol dehydrogenase, partial [Bacillota bacterium]
TKRSSITRALSSPGKYIQGPGELDRLIEHTKDFGKNVLALIDPYFYESMSKRLEDQYEKSDYFIETEEFGGEISEAEIERITKLAGKKDFDVVLGIGGGKTLDTTKAVGNNIGAKIVVVPTAASTDAPTSALSVVYTEEGVHSHEIFFDSNPDLVLVDTEIVVKAPIKLLIAGIGDALATYFEARANKESNSNNFVGDGYKMTLTALAVAELAYNTLLEEGVKAKLAAEAGVCTEALENVIEANTLLSGLGFESTGCAGAHAIHDGFTILDECHSLYHGEKVAFGTICQIVLENRSKTEIKEVIEFCQEIGLPTTLEEMGVTEDVEEKINNVAKEVIKSPLINAEPFDVTQEQIVGAILTADALGKYYKNKN